MSEKTHICEQHTQAYMKIHAAHIVLGEETLKPQACCTKGSFVLLLQNTHTHKHTVYTHKNVRTHSKKHKCCMQTRQSRERLQVQGCQDCRSLKVACVLHICVVSLEYSYTAYHPVHASSVSHKSVWVHVCVHWDKTLSACCMCVWSPDGRSCQEVKMNCMERNVSLCQYISLAASPLLHPAH